MQNYRAKDFYSFALFLFTNSVHLFIVITLNYKSYNGVF